VAYNVLKAAREVILEILGETRGYHLYCLVTRFNCSHITYKSSVLALASRTWLVTEFVVSRGVLFQRDEGVLEFGILLLFT
jgi:hypothetical protein